MPKQRQKRRTRERPMVMKTFRYTIYIHPEEDGGKAYWVEVPALPGCFTHGQNVEECLANAREAIEGYLESLAKLGEPIPEEPEQEDAVVSKVWVNFRVPA
jgi:predicted RNase H-like HicB family nuclease